MIFFLNVKKQNCNTSVDQRNQCPELLSLNEENYHGIKHYHFMTTNILSFRKDFTADHQQKCVTTIRQNRLSIAEESSEWLSVNELQSSVLSYCFRRPETNWAELNLWTTPCGAIPKRYQITLTDLFLDCVQLVEWPPDLNSNSWVFSHFQKTSKYTSFSPAPD